MTAGAVSDVDFHPAHFVHTHLCWSCRDTWWHYAGDEGCVGQHERTCPVCEDGDEPEPWYVQRGGLGG